MTNVWLVLAVLAFGVAAPVDDQPLFDAATGYRIARYRGVIAGAPDGVTRIDARAAAAMRGRAVFVDVTPLDAVSPSVDGSPATDHRTLPGAHWFPDAGVGRPTPAVAAWLTGGVRRLTHGRRDRAIVVFCLADCWMSWNAALRLRRAGYRHVHWLADGTDGWRDAGRPLLPVRAFAGGPIR